MVALLRCWKRKHADRGGHFSNAKRKSGWIQINCINRSNRREGRCNGQMSVGAMARIYTAERNIMRSQRRTSCTRSGSEAARPGIIPGAVLDA